MDALLKNGLHILEEHYFNQPINKKSIQLISGGYSFAHNYRIEVEEKEYFARFMFANQPLASKEKECRISHYVGEHTIGPKVYYQNPEQGILLTDFIKGRTAKYQDIINEPYHSLIIKKMKALHQSNLSDFPKAATLPERIKHDLERADSIILQEQLASLNLIELLNKLTEFAMSHFTPTLIHGDLNPNNILLTENQVYFIDWTDAGIADPFADLVWLAIFHAPESCYDFVKSYFDSDDKNQPKKLICYYCLNIYWWSMWSIWEAKTRDKNADHRLPKLLQQKLPTPHELSRKIWLDKLKLDNVDNLLLIAASALKFLGRCDSF